MFGIAGINVLPGFFHAGDFGGVFKIFEEGFFENFGDWTGKNAGSVHIGVAGAGEAEVDHADDFIVLV